MQGGGGRVVAGWCWYLLEESVCGLCGGFSIVVFLLEESVDEEGHLILDPLQCGVTLQGTLRSWWD